MESTQNQDSTTFFSPPLHSSQDDAHPPPETQADGTNAAPTPTSSVEATDEPTHSQVTLGEHAHEPSFPGREANMRVDSSDVGPPSSTSGPLLQGAGGIAVGAGDSTASLPSQAGAPGDFVPFALRHKSSPLQCPVCHSYSHDPGVCLREGRPNAHLNIPPVELPEDRDILGRGRQAHLSGPVACTNCGSNSHISVHCNPYNSAANQLGPPSTVATSTSAPMGTAATAPPGPAIAQPFPDSVTGLREGRAFGWHLPEPRPTPLGRGQPVSYRFQGAGHDSRGGYAGRGSQGGRGAADSRGGTAGGFQGMMNTPTLAGPSTPGRTDQAPRRPPGNGARNGNESSQDRAPKKAKRR